MTLIERLNERANHYRDSYTDDPDVRLWDEAAARIAALEEALRDSLLAHLHLPSDKCVVCDGVRSRAKALLDPAFTAFRGKTAEGAKE